MPLVLICMSVCLKYLYEIRHPTELVWDQASVGANGGAINLPRILSQVCNSPLTRSRHIVLPVTRSCFTSCCTACQMLMHHVMFYCMSSVHHVIIACQAMLHRFILSCRSSADASRHVVMHVTRWCVRPCCPACHAQMHPIILSSLSSARVVLPVKRWCITSCCSAYQVHMQVVPHVKCWSITSCFPACHVLMHLVMLSCPSRIGGADTRHVVMPFTRWCITSCCPTFQALMVHFMLSCMSRADASSHVVCLSSVDASCQVSSLSSADGSRHVVLPIKRWCIITCCPAFHVLMHHVRLSCLSSGADAPHHVVLPVMHWCITSIYTMGSRELILQYWMMHQGR